jgi:EpsI family protein
MRSYARFVLAVLLLAGTALFLHGRGRSEIIPPRAALASFPNPLGNWKGTDVPLDPDTLAVLGPGDFLLRTYARRDATDLPVDLFIAYFPTQRSGDTIHSPRNCLPGSGWSPLENRRITLSLPGLAPFPVNQYLIGRGADRQLVLYWYLAHDRSVASEYWAKAYLILDSVRLNRSDGSLIRLSTSMFRDESVEAALQRLLRFAGEAVPRLPAYIPE